MRTREEKEVLFREMREKYGKQNATVDQQHYRIADVALMLGISETTVRRIIKGNPLLKYLPRNPENTTGPWRRTPIISIELLQALYERQMGA